MRRHLIIGRYGVKDKAAVPSAKDEHKTVFQLLNDRGSFNFGISDTLTGLKKLNVYPSGRALDLLILAVHIYAADTRISRDTESQDGWTREIRIVVPVSDPSIWSKAGKQLARMLNFLTGDRWTIGFRKRPDSLPEIPSKAEDDNSTNSFTNVSLFSGGLDSLIGAIDNLEEGKIPLLVSHVTDGATSKAQDACFDSLKAKYKKNQFSRLRYWLNISSDLFTDVNSEKTTRGRSFLFFALGVLAGSGINNSFTLQVPENGLIALNVPLDNLRLGSLSTRTTHPFYMQCWNELLQLIEIPGELVNPYWNKTKGEMVTGCKNKVLLNKILPLSISCSSPAKGRYKGLSTQQCGYCLPCIIRRASLKKDSTSYTLEDLTDHTLDSSKAEGQQIRSFQIALQRLAKNPSLAKILIYKPGPLPSDPKVIDELANVYLRGMQEISKLLTKVKTKPE